MKHNSNGPKWLLFIMVYSALLGIAYSKALGATGRGSERVAARSQYQQNRQDRIYKNRDIRVQRRELRQTRQAREYSEHRTMREALKRG